MTFHKRLRAARTARGYTQQYMADYLQIDKSTYSGYETGKRQPDVIKIKAICACLGISGDELLNTGFENNIAPITDDDIKFALFGGDGEITDEMYDEVLNFAAFIKTREANKKKE